jgi:hypothetical protein
MNTFLVKWPDGTISILTAETNRHLYDLLDTEGNPDKALVYEVVPDEDGHFHITTDIVKGKIKVDSNSEVNCKLKHQSKIFDDLEWSVKNF